MTSYAGLLAAVIVLLLTAPGSAAPASTGTVTLDSAVAHRSIATFSYTLPSKSKGDDCASFAKPCAAIQLQCWQGETLVYADLKPASGNSFYLESGIYADGSPAWPEGSAVCTATLADYSNAYPRRVTWTEWATTTFDVAT